MSHLAANRLSLLDNWNEKKKPKPCFSILTVRKSFKHAESAWIEQLKMWFSTQISFPQTFGAVFFQPHHHDSTSRLERNDWRSSKPMGHWRDFSLSQTGILTQLFFFFSRTLHVNSFINYIPDHTKRELLGNWTYVNRLWNALINPSMHI